MAGRQSGARGPVDPPGLDPARLRVLREVARRGSIAAGARTLGLTASAVSQQLAALERQVATPLLERHSRGVTPTAAGALLVERAEAVLALLAETRAELERFETAGVGAGGTVRVAAVASAAAGFVSDAVGRLRRAGEALEVHVVGAEPEAALASLGRDEVELAVVDEYDRVPLVLPDRLVATPLLTERLVVVGSPSRFPDASGGSRGSGDPVRLRELARDDWILPPAAAACGLAVRLACRAAGFEPRARWESDDMYLLTRAAAAGHGVAVLAPLAVADVASVRVRALREPVLHRRLTALTRQSTLARPSVAAVLDALRREAVTPGPE